MPRRSFPVRMLVPAVAAFALFLTGCGQQQQPKSYDDDAYTTNFKFGCEQQAADRGGPQAPKDYCKCVLAGLKEKVPFDDAKKFEEQQADEKAGQITVPKNIQAVFDSCDKGA
jgi:hypothetical protein